jgi:hypothetical protein
MRAIGTYFEQVPKTVVEKILAQQVPPLEKEPINDAPVSKRSARKPARKTPKGIKFRNPSTD